MQTLLLLPGNLTSSSRFSSEFGPVLRLALALRWTNLAERVKTRSGVEEEEDGTTVCQDTSVRRETAARLDCCSICVQQGKNVNYLLIICSLVQSFYN